MEMHAQRLLNGTSTYIYKYKTIIAIALTHVYLHINHKHILTYSPIYIHSVVEATEHVLKLDLHSKHIVVTWTVHSLVWFGREDGDSGGRGSSPSPTS